MSGHLKIATVLTHLLEDQFKIGKFRFGFDPILGLIPGVGDVAAFILSFYIVWIATRLNVPEDKIAVMMKNILVDFVLGLLPIVGDISDFVYKANSKNLAILKQHMATIVEAEVDEDNS